MGPERYNEKASQPRGLPFERCVSTELLGTASDDSHAIAACDWPLYARASGFLPSHVESTASKIPTKRHRS